jgi:hypothetical protein
LQRKKLHRIAGVCAATLEPHLSAFKVVNANILEIGMPQSRGVVTFAPPGEDVNAVLFIVTCRFKAYCLHQRTLDDPLWNAQYRAVLGTRDCVYHGCLGARPDQPCAISQDESVGPIRAGRQIESKGMVVSKIDGILEKSRFVGIATCNSEIARIGYEAAEV